MRLFAQLLQRLEAVQNQILDKLSHKKDEDKITQDSKNLMTDLFRQGSATINLGIEQLKRVLNLERLTTKRDNKLESSHYSEIQKRGTRGVKRKIHYANDHESEIMVKVETEFAEGPGKFNEQDQVWLMDEDDHNSSRDDLSDREISHHDSKDPVPFHCDKCPKKFAVYKTFTRHKARLCGTLPSPRRKVVNLTTNKRDNKLESPSHFDVEKRNFTRGVRRKINYADETEGEIKVTTETDDHVEEPDQDWLMDQDDDNSSRDDRDSSNDDEQEEGESAGKIKPSRITRRGPPLAKMDFKCPQCSVRFASQLALDCHHRKIHEGVTSIFINLNHGSGGEDPVPFHCDKCPKKFAVYKTFSRHKARLCDTLPSPRSSSSSHPPGGASFLCEFCSKKYTSATSLENHVASSHSQKHCELCHFGFSTVQELQIHEQLHLNSDQPFKCVLCSDVILTNSSNLKKHVLSSHTDTQITCPTCGIRLNALKAMKRHEKIHQPGFVGYPCKICGYTFNNAAALKFHSFKHSETKQFTCEICGKGFTYQTSLKIHLASHSEQARFSCKICGKGFSYKPFLMRHEEIHSGTINYECSTCGKKFKTKNSLKQHVATHGPKNRDKKPRNKKIQRNQGEDDDQDGNAIATDMRQIIYM
ncbi:zinc finger protein 791 isoform X3 [Folsomia candida]|nr:zinc finger protein 791 isoform X3 [Folsomia candida]XP_035711521.1 zinc finger protein 791 isoform X3 [Folsomia candida]